jgi:hypothetical protein
MSNIPLSIDKLETIVEIISRDLLEKWAIEDRFTEDQLVQSTQNAIDDTVFVINSYMEHINTYMMMEAEAKKII